MDAQGDEVQVISEETTEEEGHNHESESSESSEGGENCHFHAGVEYVKPYPLYGPVLTNQTLRWSRRIREQQYTFMRCPKPGLRCASTYWNAVRHSCYQRNWRVCSDVAGQVAVQDFEHDDFDGN